MKHVFQMPSVFGLALLLSGCPDSQIPKPPPKVPEPKLALVQQVIAPAATQSPGSDALTEKAQ